jgi:hypothetical protein
LTDLLTDFFLGPPALRPAAPFFALPTAAVPEASMANLLGFGEEFADWGLQSVL